MLAFDDVSFHNPEEVEQTLRECEFLRPEHPAYSLDSPPYDFFSLVIFMKK
jgi:hypothetical protein